MSIPQRPPSTQWEPIAIHDLPGCQVWGWHQPPHAPHSVTVLVPHAVSAQFGPYLTARRLFAAIGWPLDAAASWAVFGTVLDVMQGTNPALDQPIPFPPGQDMEIVLNSARGSHQADNVAVGSQQPLGSAPPAIPAVEAGTIPNAQTAVAGPAADRVFASIEADWRAIEQLERQLAALTKQLNGQASKLQSLNRDLAPQERLAADSNDVKEWNDVRRMLRDAAANISKQVRAFDTGTVSAAGNRNRFQEIFTQYVQTRTPFDGMQQTAHEFEQHRKVCQSLMTKSGSALTGAQRDAEGKARTVLGRIRAKQRKK